MSGVFPIYRLQDIKPLFNRAAILNIIREALIKHSAGLIQSPMPGQLVFDEAHGDCHIKYGHMTGDKSFAIKIATGFYNNSKRGLPVGNGLIIVLDAETGAPQCLFQDEGWLTAWRTAAATALAAKCLSPRPDAQVGIIGTGLQAQLAIEWIADLMPKAAFTLFGRDPTRTAEIAQTHGAGTARTLEAIMATSDIIVTATPSTVPLFDATLARPGMHFVSIGADGPEKQELPTELFAMAKHVFTDDHNQCLALSDFGRAVRNGDIAYDADRAFGDLLAGHISIIREDTAISIVDLTGLAAQDIAIASWFQAQLL